MKRADAVMYVVTCCDVTQNRRLVRERGSRSAGSLNTSSFVSKYCGWLPHRQTDWLTDWLNDWLIRTQADWLNDLFPWSTVILEHFKESFVHYGNQSVIFQALSRNCEKETISSYLSVRPSFGPHGRTRLPLHGFSWNFIFECLLKICRENASFSKLWEEWRVLCMKTNMRFGSYLAEFFLEWDKSQKKVVKKIKIHIFFQ